MKKQKNYRILFSSLVEWMFLVIGGSIFSCVFLLTIQYFFNTENSIPQLSNIFTQIIKIIIFFCFILGIGYITRKHSGFCKYISAIFYFFTIIWLGFISITYVSQTLLLPSSDAKSCYDIALRFLNSEFNAVTPKGSYLSLWPFQTGLIFILEKLMRLFQTSDPLFFQKLNIFYLIVLVTAGYIILCSITKQIEGHLTYLFLMATYWPLIFSVSEVYGDFPAFTCMMCSCMFYIYYNKTKRNWLKTLCLIGFFAITLLGSLYKRNILIFVIALILITFIRQLYQKDILLLAAVIITALACIFSCSFTQKYYEHYAGNICGKGVPMISYLAMGLQYNGENAIPGGWNGFHSTTYIETDYNYDETVRLSKESIANSLQGFKDNPAFMLHFYHNKILMQWANPTHGVYWGLNSLYDTDRDPSSFWVSYLEKEQYRELTTFEDTHESIVYILLFSSLLYMIFLKVKRKMIDFVYLLPYVAFIGGFLFSIIWEGQTGAVMIYPILTLPIAIGTLCLLLENIYSQKKLPTI